jgi:hypothetical protein
MEIMMNVSSVADLTVDELRDLIREVVAQTMLELFGDPDAGLELREEFKVKLRKSFIAVQEGTETLSGQEVASRLGLEW